MIAKHVVAATLSLSASLGVMAPAAAVTHLEQPAASAHVVLVAGASGPNVCGSASFVNRSFFQSLSNGTQAAVPFKIPKGMRLVVTDVEWSAYGGPGGTNPLTPGTGRTLRLTIALTATGVNAAQVFVSRGITLDPLTAVGRPGGSEQLTTGFVVDRGISICPAAIQEAPSFGAAVHIDRIILRGYITR